MKTSSNTPNIQLAKDCDLPNDIIYRLTALPKPTRISPGSTDLVYPDVTRWLAAVIKKLGVSGYKTAEIVGMKTENSVRTAVKAYEVGRFDSLTCPGEEKKEAVIDSDDTQYLQDLLDEAETELEKVQKRFEALERKQKVLAKAVYNLGYFDAQLGNPKNDDFD